ncbi:MAG: hypothetical protein J7L15_02785 [Clostridiales bacterium]|nr:hypothetical protein [Clostridiales bacterium]
MENKIELSDKYFSVSKNFLNVSDYKNSILIKKSFDTIFDLVSEAEKGSYFELIDDNFIPIVSKG